MADVGRIENLLQRALGAAELRQSVIAHNLANVETPGFRAKRVLFEELLAEASGNGASETTSDVAAQIVESVARAGSDGNNVSVEDQVGQLMKNSALFKTYTRILAKRYKQIEAAIRGQI